MGKYDILIIVIAAGLVAACWIDRKIYWAKLNKRYDFHIHKVRHWPVKKKQSEMIDLYFEREKKWLR